jgi:hypothetical protein
MCASRPGGGPLPQSAGSGRHQAVDPALTAVGLSDADLSGLRLTSK